MKKMLQILSKSWWAILITVLLLFVQAYCELALPEYTSNIVNVGIQQSGIENTVPEVIRSSELTKLVYGMDNGDAEYVMSYYTADNSYNSGGEEILALKEIPKSEKDETIAKLEELLGLPMVMNFAMNNMTAESNISIDFSAFASDMEGLPEGFVPDMSDPAVMQAVMDKLKQLDSSIISQVATMYVRGEYEAVGVDMEEKQIDYMFSAGAMMALYAFAAMLCTIIVAFLSARVGAGFAKELREAVFRQVMRFSNREFDSFSTASLITRSTNDIQQIQMVITMLLRMLIYAPIVGIGAVLKVMAQGSKITWVIGVAVGALLVLVIFLFTVALPKFQKIQKFIDRLNLVSREILTGLPVIRAFSSEEHEKKRFDIANIDLTKVNIFVNRVMSIMMPTMMFIMNGITVLIIWAGSGAVDAGAMQVGDIMAFISYTMQIIMAFLMLSMMSVILPRAVISMKRVSEILNKDIKITDPIEPKSFDENKKGLLEFKNVYFRYENAEEDVLRNISFVSRPGETTAIIGSTGSGKSTLANLIPRFFDITGGNILVDGADIRDVTLRDLRKKIGYVPQKALLFSGTIASNIAYSAENEDDMSEEQIKLAAEIAQASEFIESKEEKFGSEISQGGGNVSGGQKQRLSIARAIAKNPEIYIFDDSFSALDFKTDIALRKALSKTTSNSTVIIVAQRISTVLNADQIIVLDDGEVAGIGKHAELLGTCEVYRDIAYSQLSAEELEGKEEA